MCFITAIVVGSLMLLGAIVAALLLLAFPGHIGLRDADFFSVNQRLVLGCATLLMVIEAVVVSGIDICK